MAEQAEAQPTIETFGLSHAEVLRLEPGDVIVMRCHSRLSLNQVEFLQAHLHKTLGPIADKHRILILDSGADLCVMRKEAA